MNCNICNKNFISKSTYYIHNREVHTHNNCKYTKCEFCKENFHSPIFNKNKKNPYYLKCEKCRELQLKLNIDIYYNKEQIQYFRNILDNSDKNVEYNTKIREVVKIHR